MKCKCEAFARQFCTQFSIRFLPHGHTYILLIKPSRRLWMCTSSDCLCLCTLWFNYTACKRRKITYCNASERNRTRTNTLSSRTRHCWRVSPNHMCNVLPWRWETLPRPLDTFVGCVGDWKLCMELCVCVCVYRNLCTGLLRNNCSAQQWTQRVQCH